MVSCQEPSPLKGSKHSLQHHPHDAALVNAHSFVCMGVEARCRPCHSTAHCQHMKRQPSLHHCCPCHGRHHCDCCPHLRHHHPLHCRPRRHCPLPSLSAIAVAVAIAYCCRCLCHIAVSHCHRHHPCHRPFLSPSLSAIAAAISVGHHHCCCHRSLPRVVALARRELYLNNLSNECLAYFVLFGQWAVH